MAVEWTKKTDDINPKKTDLYKGLYKSLFLLVQGNNEIANFSKINCNE